jgi:hypothetical protein
MAEKPFDFMEGLVRDVTNVCNGARFRMSPTIPIYRRRPEYTLTKGILKKRVC